MPRAAADVMVSAMIIEAEQALQFDTIDDVISDVARGRIVIVTDDADRENEGDLVMAAEKATPNAVNLLCDLGELADDETPEAGSFLDVLKGKIGS